MHLTDGAKADNLQTLQDNNFRVPPFYVVDASTATVLADSKVVLQLQSTFTKWMATHNVSSVAVRSSSTQEDTAEQSFAGQFATVLDVKDADAFIAALKTVFASKQSSAYSNKTGEIHAIVQQFIEPDISGVIFSVNPANGNNELVINAAQGRGTTVVDGSEAEQYFVSRLNPGSYSRKDDQKNADSLSKHHITAITSATIAIESLFAAPQDIEWAIQDDTLFILQARPITKINHLRLWDSSNISESFPGIVAPLTFSIAKRGYALSYKAQAVSGGLSWYDIESNHRTFDSMIAIFNGKMYYNLLSWYKIISLFPGSGKNQKFLDDQIATQGQSAYQTPVYFSKTFQAKYYAKVLYRVLFFKRELNDFYAKFAAFEAELARMPQEGDSQLLMAQYAHIEQVMVPQFGRTLDNDFLVMSYHGQLKRLLQSWLPDQHFESSTIIGSMSGVVSADQAVKLYAIAGAIKADSHAHDLLKTSQFTELDAYLQDGTIQADISDYMEQFGHRFAEDQKIEATNPILEPHGLYKLLQAYVQLDTASITKRLNDSTKNNLENEDETKKMLRFDRRILYTFLLKRLRHHLKLREQNRLLRGKGYGYMRALFPKVGQALATEGVLLKKDDIYYLEIEEIYQLLQSGLVVNNLQDRIKSRQAAYKKFASISMPERFITTGIPSLEKIESVPEKTATAATTSKLTGLISSPGTVEGRVVVLTEPKIPDEPYDILVARNTDPGWTPLIALAKGVIVEHGGMLSHAAIVTRELGIPSIIGVPNAVSQLKTGMRVRINTQSSCVEILQS